MFWTVRLRSSDVRGIECDVVDHDIELSIAQRAAQSSRVTAICLQELDAGASAPQALARVAAPLLDALLQFERDGFEPFALRFAARDLLRERHVHTTAPDATEGVAIGVSASGALLLRTVDGVRAVSSGEVSVRLDPSAPC